MSTIDVYELRVHGVSGTTPEASLDVPVTTRVAGDGLTGFYRPRDPDGRPLGPVDDCQLEAFSWGGLTSGSGWRALWLLLAPFTMVNVALFTAALPLDVDPRRFAVPDTGKPWRGTRRVLEAALRLIALSLTILLVLSAVSVSMDLVGWQLVKPGVTPPGWLGFLGWSWLRDQPRPFLVTALLPLILVLLLWYLGRQTWAVSESQRVPGPLGIAETPLEDRAMWNGHAPVRRQRAVHVAVAFATVAFVLLLPLWCTGGPVASIATVWRRPAGFLVVPLTGLVLAVLAAGLVLVCVPRINQRPSPKNSDSGPSSTQDFFTFLPWVALALVVFTAVLLGSGSAWRAAVPAVISGPLPGAAPVIQFVLLAQIALLVVVAGAAAVLRWVAMRHAYPDVTPAPDDATGLRDVRTQPAWAGLAPAVFALLGVLLTAVWTAGLAFAAARLLGSHVGFGHDGHGTELVLPAGYPWIVLLVLVTVAALVLVGLAMLIVMRRQGTRQQANVRAWYQAAGSCPVPPDEERVRSIAAAWGRADLDRPLRIGLGAGVLVLAVGMVLAVVVALIAPDWAAGHLGFAVVLGTAALALGTLGVIGLSRRLIKDRELRRKVGILWDLATFWPRAAHPLAPPCYMERVVPSLIDRLTNGPMPEARHPVLACHSQGTVIGAALVMQLELRVSARLSLLTYGSPLRRLYSVYFPGYFRPRALNRVGEFLCEADCAEPDTQPTSWRWRNLYRSSDPIGGPIYAGYRGCQEQRAYVDHWLPDPVFDKPAGDICWPATHAHGEYPADVGYIRARDELTRMQPGPARVKSRLVTGSPGLSPASDRHAPA